MANTEQRASRPSRLAPHLLPLLLLLVFALVTAAFAWNVGYEYRWTSDTTDTFYRIISTLPDNSGPHGGGLLRMLLTGMVDVIAQQPVTDWYQALFDVYLRSFHLALGDISLAYRIQVFPLSILFGFSAYFFFYWLSGNRWLAVTLALAALLPMPLAWAGERSGLGPVWTYTRRYFLTAWLPLLTFFYFRAMVDKRMLLIPVMASVGLASNLHSSGILLLEIMVLTWLVVDRITLKRLIQAGLLLGVGLLFSVAALGSVWKAGLGAISQLLLTLMSSDALAAQLSALDKARLAMPEVQYLFYPPTIYAHLPPLLVDVWLIATLVLSLLPLFLRAANRSVGPLHLFTAASACLLFVSFEQMWVWILLSGVLYAAGRYAERPRTYSLTAYLIICNFWVAVGGMLLFQLGYGLIDGFPLVFNQLRGIRFMGFLVFVWLAVLATPVVAKRTSRKNLPRLLLLAISCALIVTGQNVYRGYFRGKDSNRLAQKKALLELAIWAKQNTPPKSVFLVGYSSFGVLSERLITHQDKVVRNAGIDWLPPKMLTKPEESLARALQFGAAYILIDPAEVSPELAGCVRVANSVYAVAETSCVQWLPSYANSARPVVAPSQEPPSIVLDKN